MKIMFSVGEASGDLHGAVLAAAIRKIVPEAELFGMGGIKMKQAGVRIVYDIENLGVIGIGEVIRKIPFFFTFTAVFTDGYEKRTAGCTGVCRLPRI